MRRAACLLLAVIAACSGSSGPKPVSEETDCDKLSKQLVAVFQSVESEADSSDDVDDAVARSIEVSKRMDELDCP